MDACWGAVVLLQVVSKQRKYRARKPLGFVVVREDDVGRVHWRRRPLFKFPGGHSKRTDKNPRVTALREALEEAGVRRILEGSLVLQHETRSPPFQSWPESSRFFYTALVDEEELSYLYNPGHNPGVPAPEGNEGEHAYFFRTLDFIRCLEGPQFLLAHLQLLRETGLYEKILCGELVR